MNAFAIVVGYASGVALMGYDLPAAVLLATSILVNIALAPVTATIAARRGRGGWRWLLIGFLFGGWALFAALLMPYWDKGPSRQFPPASDAA